MLAFIAAAPALPLLRAPADGSTGTLGRDSVTAFELSEGAVTPDRMADLAEGRVLGRPAGAGEGAPQALDADALAAIARSRAGSVALADQVELEATEMPAAAKAVTLSGYAVPDDRGGGLWLRVAAQPDHPGAIRSADGAWWELAEHVVHPEMFGAKGDGVQDDIEALEAAADFCAAKQALLQLRGGSDYGISRPWRLLGRHGGLRIEGPTGYHSSDASFSPSFAKILKLPGFVGDSAILGGEPTAGDGISALSLEGFGIDGNGQEGNGFRIYRGGTLHVSKVASFNHPRGWGFWVDGVFFPTFVDCVSFNNGRNAEAVGGGVRFTHDQRENADGRWIRGHVNTCGHRAFEFAPRIDTRVSSNFVISDVEIGDSAGREPGVPMDALVEVRGGWGLTFQNARFVDTFFSPDVARRLVVVGDPDADDTFEDVTFLTCDFQATDIDGSQACIKARGRLRKLRLINCRRKGSAPFLDLSEATEGEVFEHCPSIEPERWRDPDGRLRNLRGGYAGERLDGANGFEVSPSTPGQPLELGVRRSGSGAPSYVRVGDGAQMRRVSFGDLSLGLAPQNTPPSDARAGDLAYSTGAGGGFDGGSGEGLYVFKSSGGWRFVA
ncbi:MAG: hypothetical protein AAGI51_06350 [Pseudomonadota bacterium]